MIDPTTRTVTVRRTLTGLTAAGTPERAAREVLEEDRDHYELGTAAFDVESVDLWMVEDGEVVLDVTIAVHEDVEAFCPECGKAQSWVEDVGDYRHDDPTATCPFIQAPRVGLRPETAAQLENFRAKYATAYGVAYGFLRHIAHGDCGDQTPAEYARDRLIELRAIEAWEPDDNTELS